LEKTKVNTRELKEMLYKLVFLRMFPVVENFIKNWGYDSFRTSRNRLREKKAYRRKKTARKYIEYGNSEHYIWHDCIRSMSLNLKGARISSKVRFQL
jgi:hypothetical protein